MFGALPIEASLFIAEMRPLRLHRRNKTKKGTRIESEKSQHPLLNKIHDLAEEIQKQRKQIMLCRGSIHTGIAENIDYNLSIWRAKSKWQKDGGPTHR